MLLSLSIHNFVNVDQLTLNFNAGFTALTGETGAGKSILIDALNLLLGARAEAAMIRVGKQTTNIVAQFQLTECTEILDWLKSEKLYNTSNPLILTLRRAINISGRSKALINEISVPLSKLRQIKTWLISIHGQHAHQQLFREENQRNILDVYSGSQQLAKMVASTYQDWQKKKQYRINAQANAQQVISEKAHLKTQIQELESLHYRENEWESLTQKHLRLHHATSLAEGVQHALETLSESETNCHRLIAHQLDRLRQLQSYDNVGLSDLIAALASCEVELNEAIHGLQRYNYELESDPALLQEVEQRMQQIWAMARKYQITPAELEEKLAQCKAAFLDLEANSQIDHFYAVEQEAQQRYLGLATNLSQKRTMGAVSLANKVTDILKNIAMPDIRLDIVLTAASHPQAYGLENISYKVTSLVTSQSKAMVKVASGGELSRISLALKLACNAMMQAPSLIFDEIDVGIGGRIAEMVGQLLKCLGKQYQVLCITHLPQVAACADQQIKVKKIITEQGIVSQIKILSYDERIEEIARMSGGIDLTTITRQLAAEMLNINK